MPSRLSAAAATDALAAGERGVSQRKRGALTQRPRSPLLTPPLRLSASGKPVHIDAPRGALFNPSRPICVPASQKKKKSWQVTLQSGNNAQLQLLLLNVDRTHARYVTAEWALCCGCTLKLHPFGPTSENIKCFLSFPATTFIFRPLHTKIITGQRSSQIHILWHVHRSLNISSKVFFILY